MSQGTATIGVPQTLSARLANLAQRPGVQSTLIISRKDGSIIQATGLLAEDEQQQTPAQQATPEKTAQSSAPIETTSTDASTSTTEADGSSQPQPESSENTSADATDAPPTPKPYEPTLAEALSAHILAFVSSASALSDVLSDPKKTKKKLSGASSAVASQGTTNSDPTAEAGGHEDGTPSMAESSQVEREEDSDVKLLRLRTKLHEIIIIPDRRYLLCVVHDLAVPSVSSNAKSN